MPEVPLGWFLVLAPGPRECRGLGGQQPPGHAGSCSHALRPRLFRKQGHDAFRFHVDQRRRPCHRRHRARRDLGHLLPSRVPPTLRRSE
eukprot:4566928-Alexandrium_andersonii.AAC.1